MGMNIILLALKTFRLGTSLALLTIYTLPANAQNTAPLKWKLNEDGSRYFQMTFLNQTWLRYNQYNDGTTVESALKKDGFDIGLRRTRIQMFGQISDRTFLYFQFGQNNFNAQTNLNGNRKNVERSQNIKIHSNLFIYINNIFIEKI